MLTCIVSFPFASPVAEDVLVTRFVLFMMLKDAMRFIIGVFDCQE